MTADSGDDMETLKTPSAKLKLEKILKIVFLFESNPHAVNWLQWLCTKKGVNIVFKIHQMDRDTTLNES